MAVGIRKNSELEERKYERANDHRITGFHKYQILREIKSIIHMTWQICTNANISGT